MRIYDVFQNCIDGTPDWNVAANPYIGYSGYSYSMNSTGDITVSTCCNPSLSSSASNGFNSLVTTLASYPTSGEEMIIAGGAFTTYNSSPYNRIVRINKEGAADTSFNIGSGFNGDVNTISVQSDGKIIVGGDFTIYNNITSRGYVILNPNGTIAETSSSIFSSTLLGYYIYSTYIQSDGKILIGGGFKYGSSPEKRNILRLNSDFTLDNSFNVGVGFDNDVYVVYEEPNTGKIYVGGNFTQYSGVTANSLIRLNGDGTIDNTFNIGTGFNDIVRDVKVLANSDVCVVGGFTTFNGNNRQSMVSLQQNGSESTTIETSKFSAGTYLFKIIYTNAYPTNSIFISGIFSGYNNIPYGGLIYLRETSPRTNRIPLFKNQDVNAIYAMVLKQNLDIVFGGWFNTVQGKANTNNIAIINRDGIMSNC